MLNSFKIANFKVTESRIIHRLYNKCRQAIMSSNEKKIFNPKKALILSKFSRYELEKRRYPNLSELELSKLLQSRGSDYKGLIHHHQVHCKSKENLKTVLEKRGIEVRSINRLQYNRQAVDWADIVFTTGGDGTFLTAASLIESPNKIVIGINSDPSRSVGYLCLPHIYSTDLEKTLAKLYDGQFEWLHRQRIRITLEGENACDEPIELHHQQLFCPEYRYLESDEIGSGEVEKSANIPGSAWPSRTLSVRALNEVFVGENHSARVSYCELKVYDKPRFKFRSSGITICTGTGSTSWYFNINRVSKQSVKSIVEIIEEKTGQRLNIDDSLVNEITKKINNALIFQPNKPLMAYTIRDLQLVGNEVIPSRGFSKNIEIRSRMYDACIVIDGGLSYKFNDGNLARFEILEQDALLTVSIMD